MEQMKEFLKAMLAKKFVKIGLVFLVFVTIISVVVYRSSERNLYVGLGDGLSFESGASIHQSIAASMISDKKVGDANYLFTKDNMTSEELLRLVDLNAIAINEKKNYRIRDVISRAKVVVLSVGTYDLLKKVNFNKVTNKVTYDADEVKRSLSIVQRNIFEVIENIMNINSKAVINVVIPVNPFVSKYQSEHNDLYTMLVNSIIIPVVDTGVVTLQVDQYQDYIVTNSFPSLLKNSFESQVTSLIQC